MSAVINSCTSPEILGCCDYTQPARDSPVWLPNSHLWRKISSMKSRILTTWNQPAVLCRAWRWVSLGRLARIDHLLFCVIPLLSHLSRRGAVLIYCRRFLNLPGPRSALEDCLCDVPARKRPSNPNRPHPNHGHECGSKFSCGASPCLFCILHSAEHFFELPLRE
jgi:hypothetical protein